VSVRGGLLPSTIVSIIAAVCLDYYFVLPAFSFDIAPIDYVPLITFLTTSTVITHLVSRVRKAAERLREQTEAALKAQARAMQAETELQAKEALRRSEAYLSEAQRLSHTGSFGWNVSSGGIFWSDQTFKIFEYDKAPSATLDMVLQRVHPDDLALVQGTIDPAAQDGSDFDFEHRLLMPDGSVKYVHVVAHAVKDASGSIEFVGAVMDITKTRRAEEEAHQARAELARVARVTTLGELSASIAHEVNQPLAAVVINAAACLRWIDREHPDLDAVRGSMEWIIKDSNRARR
jgi:PAS domain S-box-containing protein